MRESIHERATLSNSVDNFEGEKKLKQFRYFDHNPRIKDQKSPYPLSLRETYMRENLNLSMRFGEQNIDLIRAESCESFLLENISFYTFDADWYHSSSMRLQFLTGMSLKSIKLNADNNFLDYDSNTLFDLRFGIRYFVHSSWNFFMNLTFAQTNLPYEFEEEVSGEQMRTVERAVIPQISFGFDGELYYMMDGRLRFGTSLGLNLSRSKNAGNFDVDKSSGVDLGIYSRYWLFDKQWLKVGGYYSRMTYQYSQDANEIGEQNLESINLVLGISRAF